MNKNSVLQSAKHVGISPEKYLTICWILSTYIVSFPLRLFMGLKAQHVFIQLRTWRRTRALGILWAQTLSFISWTWKSSSKSIFYLPQSITKLHSKALDQSEIMNSNRSSSTTTSVRMKYHQPNLWSTAVFVCLFEDGGCQKNNNKTSQLLYLRPKKEDQRPWTKDHYFVWMRKKLKKKN